MEGEKKLKQKLRFLLWAPQIDPLSVHARAYGRMKFKFCGGTDAPDWLLVSAMKHPPPSPNHNSTSPRITHRHHPHSRPTLKRTLLLFFFSRLSSSRRGTTRRLTNTLHPAHVHATQAEISTISKLSSIRVKLLVGQLVKRAMDGRERTLVFHTATPERFPFFYFLIRLAPSVPQNTKSKPRLPRSSLSLPAASLQLNHLRSQ